MKISKENKNFSIYISKYLGVAIIAGSVVHVGTLQNGFTRYLILMFVGLFLMLLGNILEAKQNGEKINFNFLLLVTGLSFSTGFLSGGVQHYLDDPSYAGILLGLGLSVAYITYFLKEDTKLKIKNIITVIILSILIIIFSNYFMDDKILGANHHDRNEMKTEHKMTNMGMMDMTMSDMIKMMDGKTGKALEKEFISGMIPHHQGAVDMANKLLSDKTISPEIKKFAEDIITAQEGEIKMMSEWLKKY